MIEPQTQTQCPTISCSKARALLFLFHFVVSHCFDLFPVRPSPRFSFHNFIGDRWAHLGPTMPSETLSLFPSPASSFTPKSCLKHHTNKAIRTPSPAVGGSPVASKAEELRGLALQFTPRQAKNIVIEPAQAHIKHSLFCDVEKPRSDSPLDKIRSQNMSRTSSSAMQRPSTPKSQTSTVHVVKPGIPDHVASPKSSYRTASPRSIRPGSPSVQRRPSHAARQSSNPHAQRSLSQDSAPSLFPVYDHNLPLSQQHYYPSPDVLAVATRSASLTRAPSATRPALKLSTSGSISSNELQMANFSQLQALWSAASGASHTNRMKKVRLAMHRETKPDSQGNAVLEVGFSNFYSFTRKGLTAVRQEDPSAEMLVRRPHPLKDMTVPIAQVELARPRSIDETRHEPLATTIFPQTAALAALETAAKSPRAVEVARLDPNASSPQAAQLAFDAVAQAKQAEQCRLVCITQKNNFGAQENRYSLQHPRFGHFGISVKGQIDLLGKPRPANRNSRVPSYEKISLHHPFAPADKSTRLAPEVAALDITAGVLDIDVAALGELDSAYMIDSAVCALMAVALMESEVSLQQAKIKSCSFEAPPSFDEKKPMSSSAASRGGSWKNGFRKSPKEKPLPRLPRETVEREDVKLPGVFRVFLKLVGFSFEAVVWLLKLGVKVLTKLLASIGRCSGS